MFYGTSNTKTIVKFNILYFTLVFLEVFNKQNIDIL